MWSPEASPGFGKATTGLASESGQSLLRAQGASGNGSMRGPVLAAGLAGAGSHLSASSPDLAVQRSALSEAAGAESRVRLKRSRELEGPGPEPPCSPGALDALAACRGVEVAWWLGGCSTRCSQRSQAEEETTALGTAKHAAVNRGGLGSRKSNRSTVDFSVIKPTLFCFQTQSYAPRKPSSCTSSGVVLQCKHQKSATHGFAYRYGMIVPSPSTPRQPSSSLDEHRDTLRSSSLPS